MFVSGRFAATLVANDTIKKSEKISEKNKNEKKIVDHSLGNRFIY